MVLRMSSGPKGPYIEHQKLICGFLAKFYGDLLMKE